MKVLKTIVTAQLENEHFINSTTANEETDKLLLTKISGLWI